MRQPAWLTKAVAEAEALPDPWPDAAAIVRRELRRRERARAASREEARRTAAGLSPAAWDVARALFEAGGRGFLLDLGRPQPVQELLDAGLAELYLSLDEQGSSIGDPIVVLRPDVDVPEG
jgi:hypothetical protein